MNPKELKASSEVAQELEDLDWMVGELQYLAERVRRGEDADKITVLTQIYNINRSLKIIQNSVKDAAKACKLTVV